jgi:2-polyprenyl-3-methyl-5-hydroxy-6-metoxy-1,4-benzoquinol methylase
MDQSKIKELSQRVVVDTGGVFAIALCYIGDRLGLFRAMADGKALTSEELAQKTNLNERYVREWLKGLVAAEYIEYKQDSDRYFMTAEQASVLANEDSSSFVGGAFQLTIPSVVQVHRVMEVFRKGGGLSYEELGSEIAEGIDRLHRPAFRYLLAKEWLPGVPGLKERLDQGISVLDVGCGLGRSSVVIGSAYPRSVILGLDSNAYSIERARSLAEESGVGNVEFLCATLEQLPKDKHYDLILALDCIHDMADPVGALKEIREAMTRDGIFFWVEPTGSHNPIENRNPIGKMRATLSPLFCLTVSLADGGAGLGTIIGEKGARKLAAEAGFSSIEKLPIENPMQRFFSLRR